MSAIVLSLAACGGGGGASVVTHPSTDRLTCQNFKAPPAAAIAYSGLRSGATLDAHSVLPYSQDLLTSMGILDNLKAIMPVPQSDTPEGETCQDFAIHGDSGTGDTVIKEHADGSGFGYESFSGFSASDFTGTEHEQFTLDGIMYATFDKVSAGAPQSETVSFIDLHVTVPGNMDVVLNGTLQVTTAVNASLKSHASTGGSMRADLTVTDNLRRRSYWAHGLSYSDTTDVGLGIGGVDRSVAGTLYDAQFGSAVVSTVDPIAYNLFYSSSGHGTRSQSLGGGAFKFAGATAAAGYVQPLTPILYAVAVDDAGNGDWDRTLRIDAQTLEPDTTAYPSLTGPVPMAALGTAEVLTTADVPVRIDALRSYSPDGKFLTYQWTLLSRPGDSAATLPHPRSAVPGLVPDVPGAYLLQLTVSDGQTSNTQDVAFTANRNSSGPVFFLQLAVAGPDVSAHVGQTVTADGRASAYIDADTWLYEWTLVPPPGSKATLSNSKSFGKATDDSRTSFVPDVPGIYMLVLNQADSLGDFEEGDVQVVSVDNALGFQPPATVVYAADSILFKYAAGDFNGDGIMDVVISPDAGKLVVYYGSGQGPGHPASFTVSGFVNDILAKDVNNDGRTDIVADTSAGVVVLLQQSDGTLVAAAPVAASSTCMNGSTPVQLVGAGPWNSASTDSIYTVGACLDIYGNTSATAFASSGTETDPFATTFITSYTAQIADVTGDGIADIVGLHGSITSSLAVFPGQADGSFGAAVSYAMPGCTGIAQCNFVLGHFNNDGRLDAAVLDGNNLDLYLQDGSHAFAAATHPAMLSAAAGFSDGLFTMDLTAGDIDGDGRDDLLVHHLDYIYQDPANSSIFEHPDYLGVFLQSSSGSMGAESLYPLGIDWGGPSLGQSTMMVVGDFNGDGLQDVLTLGNGSLMVVYRKP